jgi:sugar O-acyltransferase (sialic acid O-acetyltransferase NeuD family)
VTKTKKLVIIGDSAFAEVAYEYFMQDSEYEVVGFAVESTHLTRKELFGLPVISFEKIEEYFCAEEVEFYAALVYSQLNRLRTRLYLAAKAKGYQPASYISSHAFVWPNVELGEHCFIFENNTIQPFVKIADNVVLWSGNHIGHHSKIQENCFIASHVVISGSCNIGCNTFIGVNSMLSNDVSIGENNWIGIGSTILKSTEPNQLYRGEPSQASKVAALRFFKVNE